MNARSTGVWYFVALMLVTIVVVAAFWKTTLGKPYFYDEADYMYAGTRGFVNNYLDRPSLSTIEFVRDGLKLSRDRSQGSNASKFIRTAGDITFYRHYHGPVYAYWIALCQALGFHDEAGFRGSGLLIHGLLTALVFLFFRIAFPEYPPVAAFVSALAFLMNKTALVAATTITQHVMYGLTAAITLFCLALFRRSGERRYWYATTAALGVAFASVETSFVLVGAVLFVLLLEGRRKGWKPALQLFWRGTLVFLLALLVVWPMGVIALGGAKGYIYLAYIAIVKRTFTPISPFSLWTFKVRTYPEEFVIPLLALMAATVGWKKLAGREAILPYLVYAWMFVGVTMIITAPYTQYHVSLLLSCAVVTGVIFGELWRRNLAVRAIAMALLLVSLGAMDVRYGREKAEMQATHDSRLDLMSYLRSGDRSRTLYVPYILVPTLHFYMPEVNTVGYNEMWDAGSLATALMAPGPPAELLCEMPLCTAVESRMKAARLDGTVVMAANSDLQQGALYSVTPDKSMSEDTNRPDSLFNRNLKN